MPNTAATADASYFQSVEARSILQRATANSYLCCPPEILEILLAAAQLSNANTDDEVSATFVTETGVQLLARAQSFDIRAWANDVLTVTYLAHIPIESRIHAGSAHAMAACLYLLQAIPVVRHYLPANTQELFERELMHHLSSIPDDDPNFKATTFPTFIAGAETRDPIKQAWVMDRLQRLLRNTPWGFIYTAMEALPQIWSLADDNSLGWVQTLKDPKMNFLIIESYCTGMVIHRSEEASRRALMDSLVAKQKALGLLDEALQNMDNMGSDVILAAVLFFINVELIESGKHGWKAHLEGAGRIMAFLPPAESSTEFLRDYILSDCFIYYILASAFMPNTSATADASYFQSVEARSILQRATANSYLCCPPEILEILLAAAQLANANTDDEVSATFVTETGVQLLARAQSFDIRAWANDVLTVTYLAHIPIESRIHAGSAHAMAACLYLLQAIPVVRHYLPANTQELFERELMHHLSSIPDDDPNFKATTFPTFIAGAETRDPIKQAWVMDRLQRLLRNTPWGFIYTAMEALPQIWSLADDNSLGWVQTLKDPKMNFLIV
ncbi:hypothetical protein BN1723_014567 [Verticillium longisporum]|uniref:Acriflavine sensitivity control protein acr-2 n=1 Tax=Verticillium longisporum TaxID=100787 RepID=A0A0G4MC27_VERLO|nr:hypothetical protein BN1723_014567 [Verticillium longisporum]